MWLLYGLCAAFALVGLTTTAAASASTALAIVSLLVILAVFERKLGIIRNVRNGTATDGSPLVELRELRDDICRSQSIDEVWQSLTSRAAALDFYQMHLVQLDPERLDVESDQTDPEREQSAWPFTSASS